MINSKATRRALLGSVIALILCFSMLLGTTLAWFSDSVTSTNNVIKAGTLEVKLEWAKGIDTPASATWTNVENGNAIYGADVLWEPGYTDAKHFKITNTGNLALKYQIRIIPNITNAQYDLAEVIDVYYIGDSTEAVTSRSVLTEDNYIGTLDKVMESVYVADQYLGGLKAGGSDIVTVVLKMQETAGNEYQGLSLGEGFRIQLIAAQDTVEPDSFDTDYDENAVNNTLPPVASVAYAWEYMNTEIGWNTNYNISPSSTSQQLEAVYAFTATDTEETVATSPYKDWLCDFYVSTDTAIAENTMVLGGNYGSWGWIGFDVPAVNANTTIGLLGSVSSGGVSNWTYSAIVSQVGTFLCGLAEADNATDGVLDGTTITVELRIMNPEAENPETDYIVISSISYTFGE